MTSSTGMLVNRFTMSKLSKAVLVLKIDILSWFYKVFRVLHEGACIASQNLMEEFC
jgi:hypothetical protein